MIQALSRTGSLLNHTLCSSVFQDRLYGRARGHTAANCPDGTVLMVPTVSAARDSFLNGALRSDNKLSRASAYRLTRVRMAGVPVAPASDGTTAGDGIRDGRQQNSTAMEENRAGRRTPKSRTRNAVFGSKC